MEKGLKGQSACYANTKTWFKLPGPTRTLGVVTAELG